MIIEDRYDSSAYQKRDVPEVRLSNKVTLLNESLNDSKSGSVRRTLEFWGGSSSLRRWFL